MRVMLNALAAAQIALIWLAAQWWLFLKTGTEEYFFLGVFMLIFDVLFTFLWLERTYTGVDRIWGLDWRTFWGLWIPIMPLVAGYISPLLAEGAAVYFTVRMIHLWRGRAKLEREARLRGTWPPRESKQAN